MAKRNAIDDARCLEVVKAALNPPTWLRCSGNDAERGRVRFIGSADELVAAGLVEHGELPGQPGRARCNVTYRGLPHWNGYAAPGRREISRHGDVFRMCVVVADRYAHEEALEAEECERATQPPSAEEAEKAEKAEAGRSVSRFMFTHDLGQAFVDAYDASPARFAVGDLAVVWDDEELVEITHDYGRHEVEGHGELIGYAVRYVNCKDDKHRRFVPAHLLLDEKTNRVRHLRLVETRHA